MNRTALRPLRTRRIAALTPARAVALSAMKLKTRTTLSAVGAICVAFAAATSALGSPSDAAPELSAAQAADARLVRGRYLVEQVGLCADCHTPRDERGQFLRAQWLKGAPLPFQPLVPMPWAPAAPPIAGLPSMTEEQAVAFLRTSKRPDGSVPRPPMPEFRLSAEDASAVAAYLKSLAP